VVINQLQEFHSKGFTSLEQIGKFLELHKNNLNTLSTTGSAKGLLGGSHLESTVRSFPSYQETEDFLNNPSDFISAKDAQTLKKHSSLYKRLKTDSAPTTSINQDQQ
jgi:hypothetical protein